MRAWASADQVVDLGGVEPRRPVVAASRRQRELAADHAGVERLAVLAQSLDVERQGLLGAAVASSRSWPCAESWGSTSTIQLVQLCDARRRARSLEVHVEQPSCLRLRPREQVAVAVKRRRDARVAEKGRESLGVDAGGDEVAGAGVAALVKADRFEPSLVPRVLSPSVDRTGMEGLGRGRGRTRARRLAWSSAGARSAAPEGPTRSERDASPLGSSARRSRPSDRGFAPRRSFLRRGRRRSQASARSSPRRSPP